MQISYNEIKRKVKGGSQLNIILLTRQPTLESFGFHVSDTISGNAASSGIHNSQLPICYPFVKWAGGKKQLLSQLDPLVPLKFDRYNEPFLGGGALFFHLTSDKSRQFTVNISDINSELINVYVAVNGDVEQLIKLLTQHEVEYNKASEDYYRPSNETERAARFIALNRTCFNGLYRVNRKGQFNVPWGKYINPPICASNNLRNVSIVLRHSKVEIRACDYQQVLLESAKEGDFIYLDPPYSILYKLHK